MVNELWEYHVRQSWSVVWEVEPQRVLLLLKLSNVSFHV